MFDYLTYQSNTAVIADTGEVLSYRELYERIEQVASRLQPHILQFCLCDNSVESLVFYLACLEAKAPVVLLDKHKDPELIDHLRTLYNPGQTRCHETLAVCLSTSGSTGSPKLVRLTEKNLLSNAQSIVEFLHINEQERAITMLPMHYSYGLSIINSHLISGATLLLTNKTYAQSEFWTFLKENQATSMAGVPYTWEMLHRLRFFRMDLPSVRTMTQSGGKLNANIAKEYIEQAAACGKRFFIMYGLTEATARVAYLPWEKAKEKYTSIGVAIPQGRFEIADDGELIYYGSNVSMGYAESAADLLKGDENHGCLHTGDIAQQDADGFYYIVGRKKRFVKIWGNRCSLDQIEQLVKSITPHCACVGVDDLVTIFVTESGLEDTIRTLLSRKTGLNSRAFAVRQIAEIPTQTSGKIDYPKLQATL